MLFFIILLVILAVLFLGHLAVFFFVTSIFPITNEGILLTLEILTIALPVSFFAGLILSEWVMNNFFSKTLYRSSAAWMVFFFYFLLASVVYSIATFFVQSVVFGQILFSIAIIVSCYGIFNAWRIKTITHALSMFGSWKGKKVIFISDIHLGQLRGASYARKIVERIKLEKPDLVLIGGDVFDGAVGDCLKLIEPFRELSVPNGIFFIFGNHEEFEVDPRFKNALTGVGIKVLEDEMVTIDGVQIVGVDYKTTTWENGFKEVLDRVRIDPALPSLLLKHVPSDLHVAEEKGVSLSFHGHTHRAQAWPLNYITKALFKGYDYGFKKFGKMTVYTSSGVGTWGPPVRVGSNCEIVVFQF